MIFDAVRAILTAGPLSLVEGRSLFVNQMPVGSLGVLLKESPAGIEIDPELIGRRRGRFQLVVRGKSYTEAQALIKSAMKELTILEKSYGNVLVRSMRAMNEPVSYPLSVGNVFELSVNFMAIYDIVA